MPALKMLALYDSRALLEPETARGLGQLPCGYQPVDQPQRERAREGETGGRVSWASHQTLVRWGVTRVRTVVAGYESARAVTYQSAWSCSTRVPALEASTQSSRGCNVAAG